MFYALAGLNHLRQSHRGQSENVALFSDLFVGAVVPAALVALLLARPLPPYPS